MNVVCLNLLIQESSSLIKKLIAKKYFENTKILRLNVFKYKLHWIFFFKGIKISNSIFVFEIRILNACI